jgi:sugar O-acyltransferase (sialic acid O-acetyltransferase NeuD family)
MTDILILGAGGHAKVVAEILFCTGRSVTGFLSDDSSSWGTTMMGLPILGGIDSYSRYSPAGLIIAIGDNIARCNIASRLGGAADDLWVNAIHPQAIVAPSVVMGRGMVVVGGAVINADSVLGDHVIVNTGTTVDHDCVIDDFVHVAPGAHLGGSVVVRQGALVGIGASIIPGKQVGCWSTIGAGAVVVKDVPDRTVAMGVPASYENENEGG